MLQAAAGMKQQQLGAKVREGYIKQVTSRTKHIEATLVTTGEATEGHPAEC